MQPEALKLLLCAGGVEHLLEADPPLEALQAVEQAVELCGRLPLALTLAGSIIQELADGWQIELLL